MTRLFNNVLSVLHVNLKRGSLAKRHLLKGYPLEPSEVPAEIKGTQTFNDLVKLLKKHVIKAYKNLFIFYLPLLLSNRLGFYFIFALS